MDHYLSLLTISKRDGVKRRLSIPPWPMRQARGRQSRKMRIKTIRGSNTPPTAPPIVAPRFDLDCDRFPDGVVIASIPVALAVVLKGLEVLTVLILMMVMEGLEKWTALDALEEIGVIEEFIVLEGSEVSPDVIEVPLEGGVC